MFYFFFSLFHLSVRICIFFSKTVYSFPFFLFCRGHTFTMSFQGCSPISYLGKYIFHIYKVYFSNFYCFSRSESGRGRKVITAQSRSRPASVDTARRKVQNVDSYLSNFITTPSSLETPFV